MSEVVHAGAEVAEEPFLDRDCVDGMRHLERYIGHDIPGPGDDVASVSTTVHFNKAEQKRFRKAAAIQQRRNEDDGAEVAEAKAAQEARIVSLESRFEQMLILQGKLLKDHEAQKESFDALYHRVNHLGEQRLAELEELGGAHSNLLMKKAKADEEQYREMAFLRNEVRELKTKLLTIEEALGHNCLVAPHDEAQGHDCLVNAQHSLHDPTPHPAAGHGPTQLLQLQCMECGVTFEGYMYEGPSTHLRCQDCDETWEPIQFDYSSYEPRGMHDETSDDISCCPKGHALKRRNADAEYWCDSCDTDIHTGRRLYICKKCDYSICKACRGD